MVYSVMVQNWYILKDKEVLKLEKTLDELKIICPLCPAFEGLAEGIATIGEKSVCDKCIDRMAEAVKK